jgi:hypothetical protein
MPITTLRMGSLPKPQLPEIHGLTGLLIEQKQRLPATW